MSKIDKVDAYINISKLIDMGEEALAGKLLKIIVDDLHPRTSFCYVPTITPKDTKNNNATMNCVKKNVKHM